MKLIQTDTLSASMQDTVATDSAAMDLGNLYEPPPVAFSFEPIGWSILAGIIVFALLIVGFVLIRKYIKNRYRREALQMLENIGNSDTAFAQIFVILKQVAMKAFGRERAGNLYGKEWLLFLEKTGKDVRMVAYEMQFDQVVYKGEGLAPEIKNEILFNAKKWVKTHEPTSQL